MQSQILLCFAIKKTTNDIPFMEYWSDKDSLDIIKDWHKIKDILGTMIKRTYDTICSSCKKEIQVPFKPDGVRPVYCPECRTSK
jgi:CxxC-x17-CxxC domain-containing protein